MNLNKNFIWRSAEGNPYAMTVYHCGPLHIETIESAPALLKLHEYGMVTIDSQPSDPGDPYWKEGFQRLIELTQYVVFLFGDTPVEVRFLQLLESDERVALSATLLREGFPPEPQFVDINPTHTER